MLKQRLFILVSRLMSSRWARDYEAHYGSCEDTYAARLSFFFFLFNHCFVLDHEDARVTIRLPTLWGKLHLCYVVC